MKITVRRITTDGANEARGFNALAGARRWAQRWVGKHPDTSSAFQYAVGSWGDVKVTCTGCDIDALFPPESAPVAVQPTEEYDGEPPTCPMCDGLHGGAFCPLEDTGWEQSFEPWWAQ